MNDIVLSADLGGTNLRIGAVGRDGTIFNRVKQNIPTSKNRNDIADAIVQAAIDLGTESGEAPLAIAVAVPGTIDPLTGKIRRAPNLPDLDGFDISTAVSLETNVQTLIENDANAAAIGERWLGASKDSRDSIMITLGTGVGGGIIIDGKIVRGANGTAGEIGHVNVEPDGLPCGCGSHGCVEQYASASAVIKMAEEAIGDSDSDWESNGGKLDSEQVYKYAVSGEAWAKKIFETQGYYLGIVLADLLNCLNPEKIVIGGGAAAAWDLFMPKLLEQVELRAYSEMAARAKIVPALLGDNAGILGAAKLAFESARAGSDVRV